MSFGGFKKRSLNLSGAIFAFFIGYLTFLSGVCFGFVLIWFFVSSSVFTKVGKKRKQKLEDEFKEGGQRNWIQVLANGFVGTLFAVFYLISSIDSQIIADSNQKLFIIGFLAHYACCCGDTWSSELGILSKSKPILITKPWKKVQPGVNGGISLIG